MTTLKEAIGYTDHVTPTLGKPAQNLTETEKFKVVDLLRSMRCRIDAMSVIVNDDIGPVDSRQRSFKERFIEHEEITLELRRITEQ